MVTEAGKLRGGWRGRKDDERMERWHLEKHFKSEGKVPRFPAKTLPSSTHKYVYALLTHTQHHGLHWPRSRSHQESDTHVACGLMRVSSHSLLSLKSCRGMSAASHSCQESTASFSGVTHTRLTCFQLWVTSEKGIQSRK